MTHILKAFASDSFISIAIQKQYKFTGSKTTIFQVRALTVCRSNDASLALEKQQNTLYLSNNITIRLIIIDNFLSGIGIILNRNARHF